MDKLIWDKNTEWFKKVYNNLINKAKFRAKEEIFDEYTERHHIIPKCLGGSDDESNIVVLLYREHVIAHMLLARIYSDNESILFAASLLMAVETRKIGNKIIKTKSFANTKLADEYKKKAVKLRGNKHVTEVTRERMRNSRKRVLSEMTKEDRCRIYGKSGKEHRNFGKHLSEETKKKIGIKNSRKRQPLTEEHKTNISKALKGRERTIAHRENLSKSLKGRIISKESISKRLNTMKSLGKLSHSQEHKKKISESLLRNTNRKSLRKVKGPDGTVYNSMKDCEIATGHHRNVIRKWILTNPGKGFSYL